MVDHLVQTLVDAVVPSPTDSVSNRGGQKLFVEGAVAVNLGFGTRARRRAVSTAAVFSSRQAHIAYSYHPHAGLSIFRECEVADRDDPPAP